MASETNTVYTVKIRLAKSGDFCSTEVRVLAMIREPVLIKALIHGHGVQRLGGTAIVRLVRLGMAKPRERAVGGLLLIA